MMYIVLCSYSEPQIVFYSDDELRAKDVARDIALMIDPDAIDVSNGKGLRYASPNTPASGTLLTTCLNYSADDLLKSSIGEIKSKQDAQRRAAEYKKKYM